MNPYLALIFSICLTCQLLGQDNFELLVKHKIDHVSTLAREPMLAQHPNGTLFVTGYRNASESPQLWQSTDLGKNWQAVDVGSYEMGAQGNSDVDLMIDAEGSIYLLSMTYTKVPEDLTDFDFSTMKGEQITLGISRDIGKTWKWHTISHNDYDDRPWISATTDGNLHIIWNDGKGVHHAISTDKGDTWTHQAKIHPAGGSSFLAQGPHGQLAVRVSPLSASGYQVDQGVDLIKLSLDHGNTWEAVSLPGNRAWTQDLSGIPRWVEPLAFDQAGHLYALWSEGQELKLAVSADNGNKWVEHVVTQSQDTIFYPYMEMGETHILVSWVAGFGQAIRHHAAVLQLNREDLTVYELPAQKLDIRSRFEGQANQLSTGGEYFPIIQLANGNFGMATPIQNYQSNRLGFTWWELILSEY